VVGKYYTDWRKQMIDQCCMRKWDPDFTKLTPLEAAELQLAHKQVAKGETYADEDIDWDNLGSLALD